MNQILQNYRSKNPGDNRTDAEITLELGERLQKAGYDLSEYKDFESDYLNYQRASRPGLVVEAGRGLSRGIDSLQGTLFGLAALGGDIGEKIGVPGSRFIRDVGVEGFQRNEFEASREPASVRSYKDVQGGADVAPYIAGLLGEALPSIGESVVAAGAGAIIGSSSAPGPGTVVGGVGGFLGKSTVKSFLRGHLRRELSEELAESTLESLAKAATRSEIKDIAKSVSPDFSDILDRTLRQSAATRYSALGAIGDSIAQNTGGTYRELYNEGAEQTDRIYNSLIAGSASGMLDAIVPASIIKKFIPGVDAQSVTKAGEKILDLGGSWKKNFLTTLAETSTLEGVTEAAQELFQEIAVANGVDGYEIDRSALVERMINAGLAGALAGGLAGTPGATVEASRAYRRQQTSADTTDTTQTLALPEPLLALPEPEAEAVADELENRGVVRALKLKGYSDEEIQALDPQQREAQLMEDLEVDGKRILEMKAILADYELAQEQADNLIKGIKGEAYEQVHRILELRQQNAADGLRYLPSPEVEKLSEEIQNYFSENLERAAAIEAGLQADEALRRSPAGAAGLATQLREQEQQSLSDEEVVSNDTIVDPETQEPTTPAKQKAKVREARKVADEVAPQTEAEKKKNRILEQILPQKKAEEPAKKAAKKRAPKKTIKEAAKKTEESALPEGYHAITPENAENDGLHRLAVARNIPTRAAGLRNLGAALGKIVRGRSIHQNTIKDWITQYGNVAYQIRKWNEDAKRNEVTAKTFDLKKGKDGYNFNEWMAWAVLVGNKEGHKIWNPHTKEWESHRPVNFEKAEQGGADAFAYVSGKELTETAARDESTDVVAEVEAREAGEDAASQTEVSISPFRRIDIPDVKDLWNKLGVALKDPKRTGENKLNLIEVELFATDDNRRLKPEYEEAFRPAYFRLVNFTGDLGSSRDFIVLSIFNAAQEAQDVGEFRKQLVKQTAEKTVTAESGEASTVSAPDPVRVFGQLPPGVTSALPGIDGRLDFNTGQNNQTNEVVPDSKAAIDHIFQTTQKPFRSRADNIYADLEREGVSFSRGTHVLMEELFSRLHVASPARFDTMVFDIIDEPGAGPGSYNPMANRMQVNKSHPLIQQGGLGLVITHEMGHFFTSYVLGEFESSIQWKKLTPQQRANGVYRYLQDGGTIRYAEDTILDENTTMEELLALDLAESGESMHEWMAYQFQRVVREGITKESSIRSRFFKEGLGHGIIDWIVNFYKEIRKTLGQWLGIPETSTKELDQSIRELMGFDERSRVYADPSLLSSKIQSSLNAPRRIIRAANRPVFAVDNELATARATAAWAHNDQVGRVYRDLHNLVSGRLGGIKYEDFLKLMDNADPDGNMAYIVEQAANRGFTFNPTKLEDIKNGETRDRILYTITRELSHQAEKLLAKKERREKSLEKSEKQLERSKELLDIQLKNLESATDLQEIFKEQLKDLSAQAFQSLKMRSATNRRVQKAGRLLNAVAEMENGRNGAKTLAPYIKAIDKLIKESGFKLFDAADAVASIDEDVLLSTRLPELRRQFQASDNKVLNNLAKDRHRFTAITVLFRDIVRRDGTLDRDMLVARKVPDLVKEIKAINQEMIEQANELPTPKEQRAALSNLVNMGRIRERIKKHRSLISRKRKHIDSLRREIDLAKVMIPKLDAAVNENLFQLGGTSQHVIGDGTKILNPLKADSTIEEMKANALDFSWDDSDTMPPEQWAAVRMRLANWLANPDNLKNHFYYNVVRTQYEKMGLIPAQRAFYDARSLSGQIYPGPLKHQALLLGVPQGEELARMMLRFQGIISRHQNVMVANGLKLQGIRRKLIKELGLGKTGRAYETFVAKYAGVAKHEIEEGRTVASAVNYLAKQGKIKTGKQAKMMKQYLEASAKNDRFVKDIMQAEGLTVSDDFITMTNLVSGVREGVERTHINVGTETFIRRPNLDVMRAIEENVKAFFANPSAANLKDRGLATFMEPLIENSASPILTDQNGEYIESSTLSEIWSRSGKQPDVFFATLASDLGIQDADAATEYITQQIDNLRDVYRVLRKVVQKSDRAVEALGGHEAPSHVAIDARGMTILPPEWVSFREGSESDNKLLLTSVAFHAAFGKDAAQWNSTMESIKTHFRGLKNELEDARTEAESKGKTGDDVDRYAEELLGGKKEYKRRLDAQTYLERAIKIEREFRGVFSHELGPNKEMGLVNEGLHLLVKSILNGPKSAFLQLNQLMFAPFRLGVSMETLRQSWWQGKHFVESMAGSLLQAFGITLKNASDHARLLRRLAGPDYSLNSSVEDELGWYGPADSRRPPVEGVDWRNRLHRFLHAAGRIWDRGVSRVAPEEAIYRAFRFFAPFSQTTGALNEASMIAYAKSMERMVMKAVDYLERHPEAARDPNFKFLKNDAALKEMGYTNTYFFSRERDAFERLHNMLVAEAGIDLEAQARMILRDKPEQVFNDTQYAMIFQMGVDHLSSDGNWLTTRAPWLKKGATQYMTPLLQWSAQVPHTFVEQFKGPKGEVNTRTALTGMLTLLTMVLPSTLAFSLIMDWWDEYLLGKKNSHRPLFGGDTGDFLVAANERFTRMGIAGIPYELVNLFMNVGGDGGNLRTFSLDNRVVLISSFRNLTQTLGGLANQDGAVTWATVGRPIFQQFGAGMLQTLDMINELGPEFSILPFQEAERRYIARLNARNYLRTAGKILDLEVRPSGGFYATPTPATPWVTQMIISAMANDAGAFAEAYRKAYDAAREMGKEDAEQYVKESFSSRHPLKTLFRTAPTTDDYARMLGLMSDRGRKDVQEAVTLFNQFGKSIGVNPYLGKQVKRGAGSREVRVSLLPTY